MNSIAIEDIAIKALTIDSREVKPRDLFMAVRGLTVDGRDYIEEAIQRGAIAILVEYPLAPTQAHLSRTSLVNAKGEKIPLIPVQSLKKLIGPIASRFFAEPSKAIPVIGITGTNGKTSIAHFIAQIFAYCHKSCGIIGTLGTGFLSNLNEANGTTPDAITIQRILADLKNKGAQLVAMEVTSHALDQNRVEGVQFHTAIFTNLTRDHLDYHQNMQEYAKAKQKLFTEFHPEYSVINLDDAFGQTLIESKQLSQQKSKVIGYTTFADTITNTKLQIQKANSLQNTLQDILIARSVTLDASGISAFIQSPWGEGELKCPLLGRFNLSNILAAIAAACIQGLSLHPVLEAIQSLKIVPGRMMRFGGEKGAPLVVVDYAHTPDALEQILKDLRQHCRGELWCVVGCGGERDRGKRPLMASVAEKRSDHLYLTQDNPRREDPEQIFKDMLQGVQAREKVVIEPDRKRAINLTIQAAKKEDLVVIAGKGHEAYQIIGTEKIPFSDELQVKEALKRRTR